MNSHIADSSLTLAKMDAHAVRILMDAGALPNDGRVELIDGALVEMSPANEAHGYVMMKLGAALINALPREFRVIGDAAAYLSDDLMLGPDIVVLHSKARSHEAKGGDFDLVIEVSNTTLEKDLTWKADKYALHKVPEYWVVDLNGEKLHIHRDPGDDGYGSVTALPWTNPAKPHLLPGVTMTLADIVAE
ncbi:MAG: Uma2 family endonuclease [Pseudomonadota bacterium]